MIRLIKRLFFLLILLAVLTAWYCLRQFPPSADPGFGLNFSLTHAQYLGLDWKKMYVDMLEELQPRRLRVMGLWEVIEPEQDKFNFRDIDFIVREAEARKVKLILTLGLKQPGWPECHEPEWIREQELGIRNQKLLEFITATVQRYKINKAISAWQVENEPFFVFGPNCPAVDRDLLQREIALVRSLDSRPIVLTDSGEKGSWLWVGGFGADIFGSTMYRKVYQDKWKLYVTYPLPAGFYRIKAGLLKIFYPRLKSIIGVELQGEPWFKSDVYQTPWNEQKTLMNSQILKDNADYARRAGFAENYFWGVEWWYWAKVQQHDPALWETAKVIFNSQ